MLNLIVKTKPSQQWLVGREFRLRVKEALDEAGISLGVPQREVALIQSSIESRQNNKTNVNQLWRRRDQFNFWICSPYLTATQDK